MPQRQYAMSLGDKEIAHTTIKKYTHRGHPFIHTHTQWEFGKTKRRHMTKLLNCVCVCVVIFFIFLNVFLMFEKSSV